MKCECKPSWNQLDFEGKEQPYCPTHDTYENKDKSEDTYDDSPILSDEEYKKMNQAYIEDFVSKLENETARLKNEVKRRESLE